MNVLWSFGEPQITVVCIFVPQLPNFHPLEECLSFPMENVWSRKREDIRKETLINGLSQINLSKGKSYGRLLEV